MAPLALATVGLFSVATAAPTLASFFNIPERYPVRVALGLEDRKAYQTARIVGASLIERFNSLGSPGDVVVGALHSRTLLDPSLDLTPTWELETLLSTDGDPPSEPQAIRDEVAARGVNWAVVGGGGDLTTVPAYVGSLVTTFGVPVFAADNLLLYRLADTPVTRPPTDTTVPVCNPGFADGASCWNADLDAAPGLSSEEAPGGALQTVPACAGSTYLARITAVGAEGSVRLALASGPAGMPGASTLVDAPAGTAARVAVSLGSRDSALTLQVTVTGGALAQAVSLVLLSAGPGC